MAVKHPHIAAALREGMARKNLNVPLVAKAIKAQSATNVWNWVAGRSAPAHKFREPLAKVLGIDVIELLARPDVQRNGQAAALDVTHQPVVRERKTEQLSFALLDDGQARLRLDITGPISRISPILLQLMQQQIFPTAEIEVATHE